MCSCRLVSLASSQQQPPLHRANETVIVRCLQKQRPMQFSGNTSAATLWCLSVSKQLRKQVSCQLSSLTNRMQGSKASYLALSLLGRLLCRNRSRMSCLYVCLVMRSAEGTQSELKMQSLSKNRFANFATERRRQRYRAIRNHSLTSGHRKWKLATTLTIRARTLWYVFQ